MAKPIVDSPVLTGQDASHLVEMANKVVAATREYKQQLADDMAYIRSHSKFAF